MIVISERYSSTYRDSVVEEKYFPFMESEGCDRRHAVLEISIELSEDEKYYIAEVFDTRTKSIVWRGKDFYDELVAYRRADEILLHLELIQGFGSLSLRHYQEEVYHG